MMRSCTLPQDLGQFVPVELVQQESPVPEVYTMLLFLLWELLGLGLGLLLLWWLLTTSPWMCLASQSSLWMPVCLLTSTPIMTIV